MLTHKFPIEQLLEKEMKAGRAWPCSSVHMLSGTQCLLTAGFSAPRQVMEFPLVQESTANGYRMLFWEFPSVKGVS